MAEVHPVYGQACGCLGGVTHCGDLSPLPVPTSDSCALAVASVCLLASDRGQHPVLLRRGWFEGHPGSLSPGRWAESAAGLRCVGGHEPSSHACFSPIQDFSDP